MTPNRFQFTLTSPHNSNYGYITLGDEKIHRIADVHQFYKALGYTDEIKKSGLMPDEFIWVEYRKDRSNKLEICLQAKIIDYLLKQSPKFRNNYTKQYESCNEDVLQRKLNCTYCVLHPNNNNN